MQKTPEMDRLLAFLQLASENANFTQLSALAGRKPIEVICLGEIHKTLQ